MVLIKLKGPDHILDKKCTKYKLMASVITILRKWLEAGLWMPLNIMPDLLWDVQYSLWSLFFTPDFFSKIKIQISGWNAYLPHIHLYCISVSVDDIYGGTRLFITLYAKIMEPSIVLSAITLKWLTDGGEWTKS